MLYKKTADSMVTYKKGMLLFGIAGMVLSLAGCGKENTPENLKNSNVAVGKAQDGIQEEMQSVSVEIPEEEGNYYEGEYITIPETDAIESAAISDSAVYYLKRDQSEALKEKIMKYDPESGQVTELADAIPKGSVVLQICTDREGRLLLLTLGAGEEEADQTVHFRLRKFDGDGSQIMEKDITELLEEEEGETFLQHLKVGKDGHIYTAGLETVWVLDEEGEEEFRLQANAVIQRMGVLPEGKLGIFGTKAGSSFVKVLDCEKKEWGTTYTNDRFKSTLDFTEPGESGIYFYNAEELYSYDPATGETAVVADWLYNDIYGDDIVYLSVREDGLHLLTCDRTMGKSEMAVLKQAEARKDEEKQIITLGTIESSSRLRGCVANFNKQSDKYRVEIIEYADGTSYSTGVQRFSNEVIAGNIPDIVNITDGTEEFYAAKGIFEDLKPYLDGKEGIDRADYFDNILTAMETDGKLYFLSPDFYIDSIVGKTEVVGEGYSWTMGDMRNLEETRGEGVKMFRNETNLGILDIYLRYNMAQFFDLNEGFCDFDNEAFREILEFADRFPTVAADEDIVTEWEMARNGTLLLLQSQIKGISDYQLCHNIFDGDISFVGYPSGFACGSVAKGGMVTAAMNAESGNKEGAWAFIRSLLEEDYQNKYTVFLPVLRSAFDRLADASMISTIRTNENNERINYGEDVAVTQASMTLSGETKIFNIDIFPAKKEEVEAVRGLIEAIDRMERFDETVLSIVSEEAGAYFSGQKSVDEVVSVIQSRANIYMNENR